MAEPLLQALARVREALLDDTTLVRATASGRRRGHEQPWRRVEVRYVDLKAGRHLQVVRFDETQSFTSNHAVDTAAAEVVDVLLEEAFTAWHVDTAGGSLSAQITRKGEVHLHTFDHGGGTPSTAHDRRKERLLPEDSPVLRELGIADAQGRIKPSRQAKYRQVEEFVRALDAALVDFPLPADRPLRIADLGCGNAYLTFAAHAFLQGRGIDVHTTGVDVKAQSLAHNTEVAGRLGYASSMTFRQLSLADCLSDPSLLAPDVVLALHACDTATDDALAAAVAWKAPLVLAAPCCHHDVAAQLRRTPTPAPYALLTRSGILRERFADTLTDALRAAILRQVGYRVDVMEFVESAHTPRNTLLRARATGAEGAADELTELLETWRIRPRLADLLELP